MMEIQLGGIKLNIIELIICRIVSVPDQLDFGARDMRIAWAVDDIENDSALGMIQIEDDNMFQTISHLYSVQLR